MKLTIGDQRKVFSTSKDISCKDVELSNDWAEGRSSLLEDNSDKIQEQTRKPYLWKIQNFRSELNLEFNELEI